MKILHVVKSQQSSCEFILNQSCHSTWMYMVITSNPNKNWHFELQHPSASFSHGTIQSIHFESTHCMMWSRYTGPVQQRVPLRVPSAATSTAWRDRSRFPFVSSDLWKRQPKMALKNIGDTCASYKSDNNCAFNLYVSTVPRLVQLFNGNFPLMSVASCKFALYYSKLIL